MNPPGTTAQRAIPFKVSAKAARLIGRENVANAEGAIVELVKNTYDADATHCFIIFCPRFSSLPKIADTHDYQWLSLHIENMKELYRQTEDKYQLREDLEETTINIANKSISSEMDLWIIDNGRGMSPDVIEKHWMVIGTNYKEENVHSDDGRVRTGAKGIGRFALDRLGTYCQIHSTSITEEMEMSLSWTVDWNSFDGGFKVLDEVTALLSVPAKDIRTTIQALPIEKKTKKHFAITDDKKRWATGTAICISGLRDKWSSASFDHLFKSLSSLVPPEEQKPLNLHLMVTSDSEKYGEVQSTALTDFDYKVEAHVSADGKVSLTIFRNELDVASLPAQLFELPEMQDARYQLESFKKGFFKYEESLVNFFPHGHAIGPLYFSFLFYKRAMPGSDENKRYPYRNFQAATRVKWLNEQGGIKIYRDDFVVRPYGEPGGKSFDWLSLGERVAQNPAPASRKGWRANPQNLAGTIKISRTTNENLIDQSNREGLIENDAFRSFSALALRVLKELEDDRSHILANLLKVYEKSNPTEIAKKQAVAVAKRITNSKTLPTVEDAITLATAFKAQQEEIRELKNEHNMLRALATLGTVLVSFSHEMGQLQTDLASRARTLGQVLKRYIPDQHLIGIDDAINPFAILKDWEGKDQKIRHWFNFAMSSVKADKRHRKIIDLHNHLTSIARSWANFLVSREIKLEISFSEQYRPQINALEIDLDSIFNNLILNSVEAFITRHHAGERVIKIAVSSIEPNTILIHYTDSGPGLADTIRSERDIFTFGETTKVNKDGLKIGTGIGMWILDSVVNEYRGTVKAFRPSDQWGFRIDIQMPSLGGAKK